MGGVYGGGGLNIAASGADHGGDGLFFDRDVNLVRFCVVLADGRCLDDIEIQTEKDDEKKRENHEEEPGGIRTSDSKDAVHRRRLYYCIDGRLYNRAFHQLPIFNRAWVFQERYLATRTLHFGNFQLFYECKTNTCFETLPLGLPFDFLIEGESRESIQRYDPEKKWSDIVKSYTKGQLTKGSDKLVAISGVARVFAETYPRGRYLFGLWEDNLSQDLLWSVETTKSTRPLPLRAPTWSWASVNGIIHMSYSDLRTTSVKILEITAPADHYGHEPEGTIKLSCERLLPVAELYISDRECDSFFEYYGLVIPSIPQRDAWEMRCSFDNHDEDSIPIVPETFYLMDVVQRGENAGTGLILENLRGRKGWFKRIGRYLTGVDEFEAFREARGGEGEGGEDVCECAEESGEGKEEEEKGGKEE
ncbi:hypothetical protein M7I_4526 [Glarea lozoyensis 74030]|nr:hypothetical protein M7I_4526 [Glarea lozoyensis 74030]